MDLREVQGSSLEAIDQDLVEHAVQLAELLDRPGLDAFVKSEAQQPPLRRGLLRGPRPLGSVIARSDNVPPEGLGPALDPQEIASIPTPELGQGARIASVKVWERPHPRSEQGHIRIRVVELTTAAGHQLRVAEASLKSSQKAYWDLRQKLAIRLAAVALLGACGAWWVARRSLRPIAPIAQRARELGAAPVGWLPRTGTRDELDQLAEVLNGMVRPHPRRGGARPAPERRRCARAAHAARGAARHDRGAGVRSEPAERAGTLGAALEMADERIAGRINELLLLESLESGPHRRAARTRIALDRLRRARKWSRSCRSSPRRRGIKLDCAVEWRRGAAATTGSCATRSRT